ncbi:thiolase family protein [Lawsonibacter celer]|uniref:thiolase family protein n=1 Tax=Lawsonibacter celer TaxID=2986526 RepID=UPI0016462C28|nr:thiolase family protein [Lawsonibacter celer]
MREVVFVDGVRSAFTNLGGGLRDLASTEIAAFVLKGLADRTGILERGKVDGLFCGNALRDGKASNIGRYAALLAGLPIETEAHYVEMQCGSAITSVNHAAAMIALGYADVLMVGGMESYSTMNAEFSMNDEPYKLIPPIPLASHLAPTKDEDITMIEVSDKMAEKWGVSRAQCDEYAARSQQRLAAAYQNGITGDEIVPFVYPATKKTPEIRIDKDEFPKPATTVEGLSKLRSVMPGGVTTAGNASGRNDGAAFLLMMSADKAKELGYTPYAKWVMGADVGVHPYEMGIGPAFSNLKAMKLAGLTVGDFDVFECNEAFAAQNLGVIREMEKQSGVKIDQERWNPNGGAISIGHPNGASGGRIAMFCMRQLEKTGGKYGLFSSCCGGGHGTTTIIENLRR